MFKSVFTKYFTAFAVIIFISFLMLSIIIASMVNKYVLNSKEEGLNWALGVATSWLEWEYASSSKTVFADDISKNAEELKTLLDSFYETSNSLELFIVDSEGNIVATCTKMQDLQGNIETTEISQLLSANSVLTTLNGKLASRYYARASMFSNETGEILGTVFVGSSSASEEALIQDMTKTIIMASIWIMLAALVAVYFISDRMVSPLRAMIAAAKQFGRGKFDSRIEIKSGDEIGELADAFNQMAESLDHLEAMRNSFLANVSHDLRTPMTTIAGFIDSINSGAIPPEEHSHYLHIISSEVHRLSRLVGQLLDISRLESGERKLAVSHFDICELARIILISFEQKIELKKLDVSFETDEDSMPVAADKDAIHQVVYNLIENAIKFSAEGGLLRISIKHISQAHIEVCVFNEGKGISKEDLPFVFDRFYKSDKSRGLDRSGAGLGLHIAKTLVETHGESISVRSEEGHWCEFSFTLKEGEDELPARVVRL